MKNRFFLSGQGFSLIKKNLVDFKKLENYEYLYPSINLPLSVLNALTVQLLVGFFFFFK